MDKPPKEPKPIPKPFSPGGVSKRYVASLSRLERVATMVTDNKSASAIAAKLSIPYKEALQLKATVLDEVYKRVEGKYGKRSLEIMKDEITHSLARQIDKCEQVVEATGDVKPYLYANQASKQLANLHGLNAPQKFVSESLHAHAIVDASQMEAIVGNPVARQAALEWERAIAATPPWEDLPHRGAYWPSGGGR